MAMPRGRVALLLSALALATDPSCAHGQSQLQPVPRLGAPLAAGQLRPTDEIRATVTRTVPSAIPAVVGDVTRWNRSCEPQPPTLVIVEEPQHGTVGMRDETATIPSLDAGGRPVACAGKPTPARRLYYQSSLGFLGADRVVYGTEHGRYVVMISVTAPGQRQ